MAGVDPRTGKVLDGFEHVQQSLERIFTTHQGSRVMREWFGNPGLRLLGENATDRTLLLWFNISWMLVELFEPRFRVTKFVVNDINRIGFADITMDGEYRPYAHLDWKQASAFISFDGTTITLTAAS